MEDGPTQEPTKPQRAASADTSARPQPAGSKESRNDGEEGKRDPAVAARRKVKKRRAKKSRRREEHQENNPLRTTEGNFNQLVQSVRRAQVTVNQPVALISQAPRSGGTLLRNLFDGHPQCHVHPYEWHVGYRPRFSWPKLDLDDPPERWWVLLREEPLERRFYKGVARYPTKYRGEGPPSRADAYPFLIPPLLHREIFLRSLAELDGIEGDRDILNAYLTGLFNAWVNNHSLDDAEKRWVVAFAPRLAWGESRHKFFGAYPDGHLISILRNPPSWLASARARGIEEANNDERLITMWNRSTQEMIEAKAEDPARVSIVRFEDLVQDAAGAMRELAAKLNIEFTELLTQPTFNSRPIGANSSYAVERKPGVIAAPVDRHKDVLTAEEQKTIAARCGELYAQALALVEEPSPDSADGRAAESQVPASS